MDPKYLGPRDVKAFECVFSLYSREFIENTGLLVLGVVV